MNLRVWWIPQVPMKNPFRVEVDSVEEARKILTLLGNYDAFEYANNIKPDYSNTGGLEVFEDDEWVEWYNEEGDDVWEAMNLE